MLKKILFQAHWLLGITLGVVMAVSGLTGSLISFDQEITSWFRHAPTVAAQATPLLTPGQLAARVQEARPASRITSLRVSSDPTAAAVVAFAQQPQQPGGTPAEGGPEAGAAQGMNGMNAGMNAGMSAGMNAGKQGGGPGNGTVQYVNPYTGEFIATPGDAAASFFRLTEQIHRGMWTGRDSGLGTVVRGMMGYGALVLLLMILTGIYLRWPRGVAAGKWKSWFAINFRLKGPAFLWSLHAVIGTFVFSVYLLSAHSGVMRSKTMSWYADAVRSAAGIARGPAGGAEQGAPAAGGRRPGGPGGGRGGQSQAGLSADLGASWVAFQAAVPAFESATMAMAADGSPVLRVAYVPKGKGVADSAVLAFDAASGAAVTDPGGTPPVIADPAEVASSEGEAPPRNESFWRAVIGGSKEAHTGRYWGAAGQFVIGLSALMMPVLLVSGYMMYLSRRRRKATWTTRTRRPIRARQ